MSIWRIFGYYLFFFLFLVTPCAAQINPFAVKRAVFAVARQQIPIPAGLSTRIPYSLVQLYRPGEYKLVGTGFLLRDHNKLLAVLPHHIAGNQGRTWDIQLTDRFNNHYRFPITISKHGGFNEKTPDLSITDLSSYKLPKLEAFEMAAPVNDLPAYSFGYTIGQSDLHDFLPIQRHFTQEHGWEMVTDRVIAGEQPDQPLDIAGYCGSPLLQLQNNQWKVVGMHIGSCVFGAEHHADIHSYAVNLSKALPLVQYMKQPAYAARKLAFQGILVDYLQPQEYLSSIEVEREGESVFWQGFTETNAADLSEYTERVLEGQINLYSQDRLLFTLTNQTDGHKRLLELSVP